MLNVQQFRPLHRLQILKGVNLKILINLKETKNYTKSIYQLLLFSTFTNAAILHFLGFI
jgi:hypothetical protein